MRKFILSIALSLFFVLLFSQCSDREDAVAAGYGKEYPRTKEAIAIIDSCMSFMQTDPTRSHQIIDSVCNAKLMSPQRCDYYHATVLFEGEENPDSALAICNKLLNSPSHNGNGEVFGDDKFLEEELCVLASNIALSISRYLETLEYANRGIAICHGQELMNYDEAMMMGRVGQAEQMLGRTDEAKKTYAEANKLLEGDKTFGGLIARISLMKKQSSLYSDAKEYDKVIAICHEALALVQDFHRDPSSVEPRPETMAKSGDATREFADFYESQMYSRIAHAYYNKIDASSSPERGGYMDSLNHYLDKWEQTESHKSPVNLANTMRELYFTGRKTQFNEAKDAVANLYKGDSIVTDYVDYLSLLAEDAASRHDFQASNSYLQRALAISDSIRQQETLRMLSEQIAIHVVQQQQLAQQESEHNASRYKLIIAIIVIIAAAGIAIAILSRRNKEKEEILQMTQQDLIETKEEVNDFIQQLEEAKQEKQAKDMQGLYDRIEQVLRDKQLYLNPDFSTTMLAEELNTNRSFISACINTITGKSFRTWLAEYRLKLFLEKQSENPETPIDLLLTQCGYKDQSTFRRQFKATFGMTPSEYKRNLGG